MPAVPKTDDRDTSFSISILISSLFRAREKNHETEQVVLERYARTKRPEKYPPNPIIYLHIIMIYIYYNIKRNKIEMISLPRFYIIYD
jgi:hypothetical protein